MLKVEILKQLKENKNLLSLPQVLSELLQEISKENYTSDSITKIILKDPSLTSRILQMSNSSFYNRYQEITTVQQAISVMGITTVKCLALSVSIFNPDEVTNESGIDNKKYFSYVLSVAAACKRIAVELDFKSTEEAFIAGLLHDIGFQFLMINYPSEMQKVITSQNKFDSLIKAEKNVFGISHDEISKVMAESWNLPQEICQAIDSHHKVSNNPDQTVLSRIVKLAVAMTSDRYSGYESSLEERLNTIAILSEQLDIPKNQIDEISSSLLTETIQIADYLSVDIGNTEEMLSHANQEIWKTYLIVENLFKERQELTDNLLRQERAKGAIESKNIAMATLSHYLNNAVMGIFGKSQIIKMMLDKGQTDRILNELPETLTKINRSVKKIVAVLEEMKEVSPIDQKKFNSMSKAMNIDDKIAERMSQMKENDCWSDQESILTHPN